MESPKEFFRRHIHRRHSVRPGPLERSPKAVFRYLANRQRLLARRQQEVLALCNRAAQEPEPEQRLATYQLTRRYDVAHMAPEVRDVIAELLCSIVPALQERRLAAVPTPGLEANP